MCDTLVVLGKFSEDGSILFGKNSDRDPNEAHAICFIQGGFHDADEKVQCQYCTVDQVKETYSVILSKPTWFKIGCEMGANEFGVVIGNEAVFTKEPSVKDNVLLGMDLMTLTLQRAKTAQSAIKVLTELLEKYGQGGTASLTDPNFIYHNSFLIADLNTAWVLETANKFWVVKKVHDIASISNGLTIGDKWDSASPNLVENAIRKGWCESKSDFNFTECYSDPEKRILSACLDRQTRTYEGLLDKKGQISVLDVMNIFRSHDKKSFRPDKGTMASICGHYNSQTIHQTTGSYVASLSKDFQTHWLTGTSAPCLSVFKPFFFENPKSLQTLQPPSISNDDQSLWWLHEKLHRLTLMDYPTRAPIIIEKNRVLEQKLINQLLEIHKTYPQLSNDQRNAKLHELSSSGLNQNIELIKNLTVSIDKQEILNEPRKAYVKFWLKLSEKDRLNLD